MRRSLFVALVCSVGFLLPYAATADEPAGNAAHDAWQIITLPVKSSWDAIRLNTATGKTWFVVKGNWKPLLEEGEAPTASDVGTYRCIGFVTPENNVWYALRFNAKTGKTWQLEGETWKAFTVSEE